MTHYTKHMAGCSGTLIPGRSPGRSSLRTRISSAAGQSYKNCDRIFRWENWTLFNMRSEHCEKTCNASRLGCMYNLSDHIFHCIVHCRWFLVCDVERCVQYKISRLPMRNVWMRKDGSSSQQWFRNQELHIKPFTDTHVSEDYFMWRIVGMQSSAMASHPPGPGQAGIAITTQSSHSHLISPTTSTTALFVSDGITRPNWARKVREMILFSVLCTVYCGRGCVSLESE